MFGNPTEKVPPKPQHCSPSPNSTRRRPAMEPRRGAAASPRSGSRGCGRSGEAPRPIRSVRAMSAHPGRSRWGSRRAPRFAGRVPSRRSGPPRAQTPAPRRETSSQRTSPMGRSPVRAPRKSRGCALRPGATPAQSPALNAGCPQQVWPAGNAASHPRCSSTSTVAAAVSSWKASQRQVAHQLDAPACRSARAARISHLPDRHPIGGGTAAHRAPSTARQNAAANSSRLESGPFARKFAGECGFVFTWRRRAWSRCFWCQTSAKLRKNLCCGVKPSIFSTGLPARDAP